MDQEMLHSHDSNHPETQTEALLNSKVPELAPEPSEQHNTHVDVQM